jgi:subtilisin family serine protease
MKTIKMKPLAIILAISLSSFFTFGCGGSSSSSDDKKEATVSFDANDQSDLLIGTNYDITTTNVKSITAKYGNVIATDESNNNWKYTFDVSNLTNEHSLSFPIAEELTITDTNNNVTTKNIELNSKDDLVKYQWHIYNDGQGSKYMDMTTEAVAGIDLNIIPSWNMTDSNGDHITGKNTKVLVWDANVDFFHLDLSDRLFSAKVPESINIVLNKELTKEQLEKDFSDAHGTSVAGIIGASGNNGGIRGEAFNANLTSLNMHTDTLLSLQFISSSDEINLVNASFGLDIYGEANSSQAQLFDAIYKKNIPIIHAQGNEFTDQTLCSSDNNCSYPQGETMPCLNIMATDCQFKQTDDIARHYSIIHVGAMNNQGIKSSYSSTGSNLWIAGLGGGTSKASDEAPSTKQSFGIVSLLSHYTCDELNVSADNLWDSPDGKWRKEIDKTCTYTTNMDGTSAASPSIAGIVALLKQINPNFTVPQIKYILAKTARNNTTLSSMDYGPIVVENDNDIIVSDFGWVTNAANVHFSNWYGFGFADASAAVNLALNCENDSNCKTRKALPQKIVNGSTPNCVKTANSSDEYECTFTDLQIVNSDNSKTPLTTNVEIETVNFDMLGYSYIQDDTAPEFCNTFISEYTPKDDIPRTDDQLQRLYKAFAYTQIELYSPNNTQSIVKPYLSYWNYAYDNTLINQTLFMNTNAFYQENVNAQGTWKLNLKSTCALNLANINEHLSLEILGYVK